MAQQHVYVTSTDTTNPWEVKSSSVRPKKDSKRPKTRGRKNTKNSDKFDKSAFEKYATKDRNGVEIEMIDGQVNLWIFMIRLLKKQLWLHLCLPKHFDTS